MYFKHFFFSWSQTLMGGSPYLSFSPASLLTSIPPQPSPDPPGSVPFLSTPFSTPSILIFSVSPQLLPSLLLSLLQPSLTPPPFSLFLSLSSP